MSDCGTADPPTYIARIDDRSNFPGFASRCCSTDSQIVGTPPTIVDFSRTNRSTMFTGSRCGPGIAILAPTITQANGMPQALAWNIGTTGVTTSRSWMSMPDSSARPNVWRTSERCEYSTPFDRPVVPVV